ncbi:MAG: aldo/keto reductase, partial [Natronospirillum sp.]
MNTFPMSALFPTASPLIYGCMNLGGPWEEHDLSLSGTDTKIAHAAIEAALEAGITVFDHADIYKRGKAESVFGEILQTRPGLRDRLILQSKGGIRFEDAWGPQRFDFSPEWIIQSVEGSLRRLQTDYLDVFLLHRPDALMEPELIAEAFAQLHGMGKVKYFGVSNMQHHQMAYLQSFLDQPLIANQLEMSLTALDWVNAPIDINTPQGALNTFTPGTLEYCQQRKVQLQAWS